MVVKPIWNIQLNIQKPIEGYPKPEDLSLGAELKRRRLELGITQKQAALRLGILPANYARFERNVHIPHIKKRKEINKFLGFNYWDDGSNSLGNRLLQYRLQNQLSAKELGKVIGVSRNTIKRLELGNKVSGETKALINHWFE